MRTIRASLGPHPSDRRCSHSLRTLASRRACRPDDLPIEGVHTGHRATTREGDPVGRNQANYSDTRLSSESHWTVQRLKVPPSSHIPPEGLQRRSAPYSSRNDSKHPIPHSSSQPFIARPLPQGWANSFPPRSLPAPGSRRKLALRSESRFTPGQG